MAAYSEVWVADGGTPAELWICGVSNIIEFYDKCAN